MTQVKLKNTKELYKAIPNDDFPTMVSIDNTWYFVDPEELYNNPSSEQVDVITRMGINYTFNVKDIEFIEEFIE
jgi:uncharacterized membrane protein